MRDVVERFSARCRRSLASAQALAPLADHRPARGWRSRRGRRGVSEVHGVLGQRRLQALGVQRADGRTAQGLDARAKLTAWG